MQNIIAMEVLSVVSEKGFSLDELVFKTKELFEEEGPGGICGINSSTDERENIYRFGPRQISQKPILTLLTAALSPP
jgi:hypothetical protein